MDHTKLAELRRHLSAAVAILDELQGGIPLTRASGGRQRNPQHFRESGHLTDEGVRFLYSLFDAGRSAEQAAAEMNITVRAAASRRQQWAARRR